MGALEVLKKEIEEINIFLKKTETEYNKLSDGAKNKVNKMFNKMTQ